jgi:diketogulonate reductase-like aldo/keto reductase
LFLLLLGPAILFLGHDSQKQQHAQSQQHWLPLAVAATTTEALEQEPGKTIPLRDGQSLPRVGLGVALTAEQTYAAVVHAIMLGYGLIDTAAEASYGNEDQVGRALMDTKHKKRTKRPIFVATKLWDTDHGFDNALRAFWKSYQQLNTFAGNSGDDENESNTVIPIDLYLVHSPYGGRLVETWDALLWLKQHHGDKVKSIGVSNFGIDHLEVLRKAGRPMPVVNQIEMHPLVYAQRNDLLDYCFRHEIAIQAFGSLMHGYDRFLIDPPPILSNMVDRYRQSSETYAVYNHHLHDQTKASTLQSPTVAHILLQWALQHGFAIIPKSSKTSRITENVRYMNLRDEEKAAAAVEFWLSDADMKLLDEWGEHVPYDDRNIYKDDWNWNPIDEAPLHAGRSELWPKYDNLAGLETLPLGDLLDKLPSNNDFDEDEYWEEYWRKGIRLEDEEEDGGDDDDDFDDDHYREHAVGFGIDHYEEEDDEEDGDGLHEEL